MNLTEYIASVSTAANTILEGMAVTFSHLFREPITIQYPDKTDRPERTPTWKTLSTAPPTPRR